MADVPCLPPGVTAQFFSWPVVDFRAITISTETGDEVEARWVVYQRGKASVAVIWAASDLVAVDPHPESNEPHWVDGSLVTGDDNTLRATADAPCQWRRHKEKI
jgi:hypothetical protein